MPSRTVRYLSAALLFAGATAGCGDGTPVGVPQTTNVSGNWTYSASNVAGGGISCNLSGMTLNLQQTGSTFAGTYSGGTLSCAGPGGAIVEPVGAGAVAGGSVTGTSVTFDFDTPDFRNAGSVSGQTMSGTLSMRIDFGSPIGVVTMTGNFSAVRNI